MPHLGGELMLNLIYGLLHILGHILGRPAEKATNKQV